jgi:hypothetical protein
VCVKEMVIEIIKGGVGEGGRGKDKKSYGGEE